MNEHAFVRTDLHGHTHFSDGRTTPEEYVRFRAKRRFEVIALSDHDTFAGVARAHAAVRALPVDARPVLVPAMEATSFLHFGTDRAEQLHVLAYFPPSFLDDGRLARTQMAQRAHRVHEAWRAYVLDFVRRQRDEVRAALDEPALRASSADPEEFPQLQTFILRIAERCPDEFKSFQLDHVHFWDSDRALFGWSPEELIDTIRNDGGIDVIAHPIRYKDKARLDDVIRCASGVEAYTSRHSADVAARFRTRAEELGKHWTASTDDHQHRPYVMPASGTPRHTVNALCRSQD
jgi:3',5'-nucleoside bisphosphate phosphatase